MKLLACCVLTLTAACNAPDDGLSAGGSEAALFVEDDSASDTGDGLTDEEAGCWVTGIGHIGDASDNPGAGRADQDSFGGNAKGMKDGTVQGEWQNTTHLGDLFHGDAKWLKCWNDGGLGPEVPVAEANVAMWGGPGLWNHQEGYRFLVYAEDRAEGGHHMDYYSIYIFDSTDTLIYSEGDTIDGGNFQIHPPNNGHPYSPAGVPGDADEYIPSH